MVSYGYAYQETESYRYMATEKLGSNLDSQMESSDGSFTVSTTMKLAVNLVRSPGTILTLSKWNQRQGWLCNLMCVRAPAAVLLLIAACMVDRSMQCLAGLQYLRTLAVAPGGGVS